MVIDSRTCLKGKLCIPGFAALLALSNPFSAIAQIGRWSTFPDTADVIPREECGFAQAGGKFYLLGGRGKSAVQEYNPQSKAWKNLKPIADTLNHFQAVSSAGLIYIICAFKEDPGREPSGKPHGYPTEPPASYVYIFDPLSDTWVKAMPIPEARKRGSAGVVEYNGNFYVVLGNTSGHSGPGAPWLDEFDPTKNTWTPLPDAPRFRDHFQAAIANGKIFAMGGRQSISGQGAGFTGLEKVDVYDLTKGTWSTLPSPESDMKFKRSGGILGTLGDEIIFAGGSNPAVLPTGPYGLVDALNTTTNTWRSLAPLNRARQVAGGFINNSGFYVASGSGGTGGNPVLRSMEVFFMKDSLPPTGDVLVAGKLAPMDSTFNLGIVTSGQSLTKTFLLRHTAGNQGVLISSLKISGDPAYQVKTLVAAPYLVRPGGNSPVEIVFTSNGSVPAASNLEVTFAVPPGATLKIPLDANRTAAPVHAIAQKGEIRRSVTQRDKTILFKNPDQAKPRGFSNALGRRAGLRRVGN